MAGLGSKVGGEIQEANIDWELVKSLCKILCTQEEIANIIGVCVNTLNNRSRGEFGKTFQEWSKQHRSSGQASLRRAQYKLAIEGNPTMLIWLGKQFLGQKEAPHNPDAPSPTITYNLPDKSVIDGDFDVLVEKDAV